MVHAGVVQHAQRAAVGVRQDRLRPKPAADGAQSLIDFTQRGVPTDALKIFLILGARALGNILLAAHGIQHALGGVYPVKIFGDFAAKKSPRNRVLGIPLYLDSAAGIGPIGLNRDQDPTGVRTIVRTCGIYLFLHSAPAML